MYRQKGTGRARHGSKKAPIFRGGGKAFGPKPRSFAIDLPKKVRALALKHALSAKAKSDALIVIDNCELKDAKTKELKSRFSKLGLTSALIIDGAEVQEAFAKAARNLPRIDVLPVQGINVYDILQPRQAGPDQGGGGSAGGAVQMSALKAYDVILAPVITEKSSIASEANQVIFKVRRDATKPEIKAAIEQLFKVKVLAVNTILRKGKTKRFRGIPGKQQDVKKAIVRLAEGDKIDVTTRI